MLQRSSTRALFLACLSLGVTQAWICPANAADLDADGGAQATPDAGPPGIMVRPFKGPRSKSVEEAVIRALEKNGETLVPAGFEGKTELGKAPGPYVEVARENNIRAYITGTVKSAKSGWSLELNVRNGADGKPLGPEVLTAKDHAGLLKSIKSDLIEALGSKLGSAQSPASKAAAEAASKGGDSDEDSEKASSSASAESKEESEEESPAAAPIPGLTTSPLELGLGILGGYRSYSYNQPVGDAYNYALQEHSLPFIGGKLQGQWFPGAHFTTGILANIGITFSFWRTLAAKTDVPPLNKSYPSKVVDLNLGLRGRIPFDGFRLGINAGWGKQQTVVEDRTSDPLDTGILPDADYSFLRFGPDIELPLLGLEWKLGAFYRIITVGKGTGQIGAPLWFPGATASGFDIDLDVAIPLTPNWAITVAGELRQIGLNMHSKSDAVQNGRLTHAVAGGAEDMYIVGAIGARWSMDPPGPSTPEKPEAPEAPAPQAPPPVTDPELPPE